MSRIKNGVCRGGGEIAWNFSGYCRLKFQHTQTDLHLNHRAYKKSNIKAFLAETIQLTNLHVSTAELPYSVSESKEWSPSYMRQIRD